MYAAIAVIVLRCLLLLVKTGVKLNTESESAYVFQSLFGIRVGKWVNLKEMNRVRLHPVNHSAQIQSRGPQRSVRIKGDKIFVGNHETKKELLYDFRRYADAEKAFDWCVERLGF
jgi:hypothetical protein